LVSPRRKLLVAIVVGVALTGPPVLALNYWLSSLVERQGREELEQAARRHMVLAEVRVARAMSTLDELAGRGVDSCRAGGRSAPTSAISPSSVRCSRPSRWRLAAQSCSK
jgi:hypothetical protein